VAAAMSLQGEMHRSQKAIWMGLIALLLVVELRAISKDRLDANTKALQDQQRQAASVQGIRDKQDKDFKATAEGLEAEIQNSEALMNEEVQTNSLTQKSLANITGGDSFVVLEQAGNAKSPGATERPIWLAEIKGDSNLHDVTAQIVDLAKFDQYDKLHPVPSFSELQQLAVILPMGDFAVHTSRTLELPGLTEPERLNIFFSALNGLWTENYAYRLINQKMEIALQVTRLKGKRPAVIFKSISKGFPTDKAGRPLDESGKPLW
jgi:hypothetical protein